MSPLNAAICTTTYLERQNCYGPGKKILFEKQLFDLVVNGQGPTKVIMVRNTPPYRLHCKFYYYYIEFECVFLLCLEWDVMY
jgi:hypothetical protein